MHRRGFLVMIHIPKKFVLVLAWYMHLACSGGSMNITIITKQFKTGDPIPTEYTCDGLNSSPEVWWDTVPAQTRSLALVCQDPDAPVGIWDHWIIFNIPPHVTHLKKNIRAEDIPAVYGTNSWGNSAYGGPCPPSGTHRYFFMLYALDKELSLTANATKKDILKAIEGHVIQRAQIMGTYQRKK